MTREERIVEIAKIMQDGELKGQRNGTKITYNTDDIVEYGMQRLFGAEALDNVGYRKEQDLLKEFVEWYKQMLIKDHDDKAWMMNHTEEQEVEDRYYYRGQCNAIQRLITLLDSDLKKFLEDRNEL